MDKTLQTKAWNCLPKEFKEEVKKDYQYAEKNRDRSDLQRGASDTLEHFFGHHNLTSDAEGEEMLHIRRSEVTRRYEAYSKESANVKNNEPYLQFCEGRLNVLTNLFGSKCLPDEYSSKVERLEKNGEPKPAKPKFKVGDRVITPERGKNMPLTIRCKTGKHYYAFEEIDYDIHEDYLEPYTEPEENVTEMKPIESKVSVYLATKKEDEEFRMLLHENGFVWNIGSSLIDKSNWASAPKDCQIHFVYPDKTVTYFGERTEDTLTFTEFKKRYFEENVNLSEETANCDKSSDNPQSYKTKADTNHFVVNNEMVDRIIKDSFSKERRLHIAAMVIASIMGSNDWSDYRGGTDEEVWHNMAKASLGVADALIKEAEKGNSDGED